MAEKNTINAKEINFGKRFPKFDFGNAKRFGQNFLKNKNIAGKIVEAASVNENDVVLEVGPGKGRLTEILAQKAKYVIAVEKDKKLADFLMDKFSAKGESAFGGKGQKNLEIVHKDILNFDLKAYKLKPKSYKIVANIPYYITSRFLRQFLESKNQPSLMALMVQKEVALRIVAGNNKESLLSIGVKAYGKPRIVANVSAGNFFPKPKVNSAIILIGDISKENFSGFLRLASATSANFSKTIFRPILPKRTSQNASGNAEFRPWQGRKSYL